MERKLQVFVSSTYLDLKEERQAAVQAILKASHIPAGMELFTAGDESQWEVITQWIDASDMLMLILGARYGSIEQKSGKSYTQLEYEYAVGKGKPVFAVIMSDEYLDARVKREGRKVLESDHPKELAEFRKIVQSKMCSFFDSLNEVKLAVHESVPTLAKKIPHGGWVRYKDVPDATTLAAQVAKLSEENEKLRASTSKAEHRKYDGRSYQELKEILIHRTDPAHVPLTQTSPGYNCPGKECHDAEESLFR
jgi:nucleoside 2-deoxyribosyltransferase